MRLPRREALKYAGVALAAGFTGIAQAEDIAPPKGPKIGPPPEGGKAGQDLSAGEMIGMKLRVVHPGEAVTQDYSEGRLTVTVDRDGMIKDIKVG